MHPIPGLARLEPTAPSNLPFDAGRVTLTIWRWQGKASPVNVLTGLPRGVIHPPSSGKVASSRLRLHTVNMLRSRESARTNVGRIALDRRLDHRAEIAVAADKFRGPRRQSQHVFQHQHLAVASRAGADADGRNVDRLRDLARQRLGHRFNHDRKGAGLRYRKRIVFNRLPASFVAPLG